MQGWIALGAAAVAVWFFGRKGFRSLARKGAGADCGCCDGGGGCGGRKRKAASPASGK